MDIVIPRRLQQPKERSSCLISGSGAGLPAASSEQDTQLAETQGAKPSKRPDPGFHSTGLGMGCDAPRAKPLLEEDIVRLLVELGQVSVEDIVDSTVRIHGADRRNRNFVVQVNDRHGLFVKLAKQLDAVASVANEAKILALLAAAWGASDRCFPELVLEDEGHRMIVTRFISGRHLSPSRRGWETFRTGDMHQLGCTIAQVHRLPPPETGRSKWLPTGLLLHKPTLSLLRNASMANIRLIQAIQANAGLCRLLDAARAGWRSRRLIHGDLKFDNLCVATEDEAERFVLFDWELACRGDPGWDVGSVLGELLRLWLVEGETTVPVAEAETSLDRFAALVRAFLDGYASVIVIDDVFIAAAIRLAVVRLLQTAFEALQFSTHIHRTGAVALQMACNIAERPAILTDIAFGVPA